MSPSMVEVRVTTPGADPGTLTRVWLRRSWMPPGRATVQGEEDPAGLRPAVAQEGAGGPAEFLEHVRTLTPVCLLCSPHHRGDWDRRG